MKALLLPTIFLVTLFLYMPLQAQGKFTDSRDGRVYRTVTIGKQTWMAENLAYIPRIDKMEDGQFEVERYWVYDYYGSSLAEAKQTDAYKTYGVLYNWIGACNSCPEGWHLPMDAEWQELEKSLGMSAQDAEARLWRKSGDVGTKMMSKDGWNINFGTDDSGFGVLPGGCRGYNGFEAILYVAFFWTASPTNGDNGIRRAFLFDDAAVNKTEERRYFGCSVRCVKD